MVATETSPWGGRAGRGAESGESPRTSRAPAPAPAPPGFAVSLLKDVWGSCSVFHQGKAPSLCPSRVCPSPVSAGRARRRLRAVGAVLCALLRVIWVSLSSVSSPPPLPRLKGGREEVGGEWGSESPYVCGERSSPRPWHLGERSSPRWRPGGGGTRTWEADTAAVPAGCQRPAPAPGGHAEQSRRGRGFTACLCAAGAGGALGSLKGAPAQPPAGLVVPGPSPATSQKVSCRRGDAAAAASTNSGLWGLPFSFSR